MKHKKNKNCSLPSDLSVVIESQFLFLAKSDFENHPNVQKKMTMRPIAIVILWLAGSRLMSAVSINESGCLQLRMIIPE
jgi:hypothetical protein